MSGTRAPEAPSPELFPEDFVWGAATSAHQIEGSPLADGAGPSIWHHFERIPGRIHDGETADIACDHYRRFPEDVALLERLELGAYRFSLAWGRILPEGRGRPNAPGIGFYDRLVDALLAKGIEPWITLYHWDLPAALQDRGGWIHPDSASWFADYAAVAFRALGDRVRSWITLNEPWVIVEAGHGQGTHPPGHRDPRESATVAFRLLRAHADTVRVFRAEARGQIGLVVNLEPKDPASRSTEDLDAARRADIAMNRLALDPVFFGRPADGLADMYGEYWPRFPDADWTAIAEPIDFLGVNYYSRGVTTHADDKFPTRACSVEPPGSVTDLGWEIHAPSFTRALTDVRDRYGDVPIYVTENGAAFPDPPAVDVEPLPDPRRVVYLRDHLRAAREARRRGVDLRGYFVWSLLDNFEWTHGTSKRFGIVHVDYATQRRTLKESALFYRDVVRTRGAVLDAAPRGDP